MNGKFESGKLKLGKWNWYNKFKQYLSGLLYGKKHSDKIKMGYIFFPKRPWKFKSIIYIESF